MQCKSIYTDIRKQTYNWVLEIISPQSLKNTQKNKKHMFSITFVLLLTVITYKYRR